MMNYLPLPLFIIIICKRRFIYLYVTNISFTIALISGNPCSCLCFVLG